MNDPEDYPTIEMVYTGHPVGTLPAVIEEDPERWAPIAAAAAKEPDAALDAFTVHALRLLANKPRNLSYRLQQALGQYDKRVALAELAITEANKHKPAGGWREPVPAEEVER